MNYKGTKDKKYICGNCHNEFAFKGYSHSHIYCSQSCSRESAAVKKDELRNQRFNDWLNNRDLSVKFPRKLIREFLIRKNGYQCAVCGINSWNGKLITLWCDHIDGDASNNHPNNFRLVCPNCDSQSATFGAKNYGNGRKSKGLPQYG